MTPAAKRVWLYWLLLLLPTLAVAAGAFWLLRREQARLDEQARQTAENRRAAVEARARLIAENVELLVSDVENALMATLREAPGNVAELEPFLAEWKRSNPFVRASFHLDFAGRPAAGAPTWAGRWMEQAPWRAPMLKDVSSNNDAVELAANYNSGNAAQTNIARARVQEVAKLKGFNQAPSLLEQSGWHPWRDGADLRVIGWRQFAGGLVAAVEIETGGITAKLLDMLPAGVAEGEGYELRDGGGAVVDNRLTSIARIVGDDRSSEGVIRVPISDAVLPGWEVVAVVRESESRTSGGAFFAVSALLVAIFVAAILAGGALLLRQARLSEAEAAQKTSFVANVSHEFKTPLTTIRLYSELLADGRVREEAKRGEYLRTIGRETQRLARLVNNVLDFSRLEQGRKTFAKEPLDLGGEVRRVLATLEPRLAEAGMTLSVRVPDDALSVATDRDALEQVLLNLVDNACKYAASGGEVAVTVGRVVEGKGGAHVIVADRGPGVPSAHWERIFEKFHRVDDTLTSAQGGAGLGLSIARQLARGLGGELRYRERVGGGAEFILDLP